MFDTSCRAYMMSSKTSWSCKLRYKEIFQPYGLSYEIFQPCKLSYKQPCKLTYKQMFQPYKLSYMQILQPCNLTYKTLLSR